MRNRKGRARRDYGALVSRVVRGVVIGVVHGGGLAFALTLNVMNTLLHRGSTAGDALDAFQEAVGMAFAAVSPDGGVVLVLYPFCVLAVLVAYWPATCLSGAAWFFLVSHVGR